jgi:Flp pilus assembly protein TadD
MRNDDASAIREITEALDRLPPGPATGAAHLSRGNAYLMNREYEEAANDFSIASNEYPDSKAKAFCEFRRAVALEGSGDNEAALLAINLSLDQNSESADAHVFKAQQLLEIEDAKGAIDELSAAINLGEGLSFESGTFDLLAKARSTLGLYSLALEDHQRALELEPTSSALHHNHGMTLLTMGELEPAIKAFDRAIKLDKLNAGALNNRGIARSLQGDLSRAFEDYRDSTSLFAGTQEAGSPLRNLAIHSAISGDLGAAIDSIHRARVVDPESPFNDTAESLVLLYDDKVENSLTILSNLASQYDVPEIKVYLSLPMALSNRTTEAREIARDCLEAMKSPLAKLLFHMHLRALRNKYSDDEQFAEFARVIDNGGPL